ncbi:zinc finger protein without children isoform X2 [Bombus vancouverensis nearcticus]|uniref:zinc finger protein without children isoform X2 n=1 Tax=Bombus vancouverensis nearcticus TaxID=2705178 RepID=UPI00143BAA4E|nr:zinc finger MYM-type protein 3 isoform X2 [Bombus vancouverensis nearcticus]
MDSNIDMELSTNQTQKDSDTENETKTKDMNESNRRTDITTNEEQRPVISKEDENVVDENEGNNKIKKKKINMVDEIEKNLSDENSKSIQLSTTTSCQENLSTTKSCQQNVSGEGNLIVKELSLQESNTSTVVTDCNDTHSLTLHESTTKNVSQEKGSIELMISNTIDKDDIDKLSDNVNVVECTKSKKCLGNMSEEVENVNIDGSCDLHLAEKEIVENVLQDSQINKQFSVSEKNNSDNKKTDPMETSESNDRNVTEKNIIEPENTEFVQFSQEKHGDAQIESQSMDAEDPFGGDSLTTENIESMETDDLTETNIGFPKLCSQTDNLPVIVSNEESSFSNNKNKKDNNNGASKDSSIDILHSPNVRLDLQDTSKTGNENSVQSECNEDLHINSTEKCDNQTKKSVDEITPMDTEEEQSNVLPGQDDELCIIPDSMKVIIPEQTEKSNSSNKESIHKDNHKQNEIKQTCENSGPNNDENKDLHQGLKEQNTTSESIVTHAKNIRTETDSTNKITDITTDVINIDEESKNSEIEEITTKEICKQCNEEKSCKIKVKIGFDTYNVCSKTCKALFKVANNKAMDIPSDGVNSKREKRCANCLLIVEPNDERNLSWETMEFCNEECLGKFQTKYGSYCRNCNGSVQAVSLGKYCVRFGYDVRQFCCSTCLEEFKKGLKVCSYCQKDISSSAEGFLAPVGEKGQFKDFCTQDCMEKYSKMSSVEPPNIEKKCCSVCQEEKIVHCEVQIDRSDPVAICSEPCFAAFKFVKKVDPDQCSTCKKFFELPNKKSSVVFYENEAHTFCSKTCLNVFIITNRKIVPCNWCKVKKYNFDMIKKELKTCQVMMMCSLNCLTLYQVSINAVSAKRINCDFCKEFSQAQYHLTMSDATIRNFCSYHCVMNFQAQYTKSPITIPTGDDPVPTGMPKRTLPQRNTNSNNQKVNDIQNKKNMPVISSVTSLATIGNGQSSPTTQQNSVNNMLVPSVAISQNQTQQVIYKQHIITRPPSPIQIHNKTTQCKPVMHTKGVSVRPHPCTKASQTDGIHQTVIPIPVPIYVPFPMHMYTMPFPVPLPFPLPIPVPIFIPTTRNSAKGIFKEIKRIQEKIPADPFEAELLMMAEMVATEKKANETDSDSTDDRDEDTGDRDHSHSGVFSPEGVDSSNTFGDDMLQMALKMATGELDEPAVDLEAALTPNTITATQAPTQSDTTIENDVQSERLIVPSRGRKRMVPYKPRSTPNKRGRRVSSTNDMPLMPPPEPQPPPQPRIIEPIEKPDANMALKYTFGVNAWRQWVVTKNAELEKQSTPIRKMKLFKTDLLQLTADELNYSLCLFVKEVKKPNGAEYAPDTIYYLCLGIQQYLFENNRIDNIFTDSYYERFTDCLNEVAKKFSVLYNDAQYIVTRVEEEHLWECKQLGAHSPHVLLNTLMFFNTKHFNLVTVEEHMQLSFSHIMKHWKRNPAAQLTTGAGKVPGSRNVLLRFYPPQSALGNSRKKKVYEQQENEENPLRCPVKLYEFYLSKCPESVKTRNDVFYLLPERSCVPDSPVWYSTSPLAKEHLIKMLYRIKMVKEINVALLTS